MDHEIQPTGIMEDVEVEMIAKELAEDAEWKKIQKNTFTRWCNEQLKCVDMRLENLETDLGNSLALVKLVEVLSKKKLEGYNKNPGHKLLKLENATLALQFLEKEGIKLVNTDSEAIVDGNLKLILGLIWTLILQYSISSMPMTLEEVEPEEKVVVASPQQRLLGWIQNKVPEVRNFKEDWQSGRNLGALVDSCAPGLCPDWEDWDSDEAFENNKKAMKLADDWLSVPPIMTAEEITNPNADELSVMAYLSQFSKAELKPGAPLKPKPVVKQVITVVKETVTETQIIERTPELPPANESSKTPPPNESNEEYPPPPEATSETSTSPNGSIESLNNIDPIPEIVAETQIIERTLESLPAGKESEIPPLSHSIQELSPSPTETSSETSALQNTSIESIDPIPKSTIAPTNGTVEPIDEFDANRDAALLRKVMKDLGDNGKPLIQIISNRTNDQRQKIREAYSKFGKDLRKDLKSELIGNFSKLVQALMSEPREHDLKCILKATNGLLTNHKVLIEILATRLNAEIGEIKQLHLKKKGEKLEKLLERETKGYFRSLLLTLAKAERDEESPARQDVAENDAYSLFNSGKKNHNTFITVLPSRNFEQHRLTALNYTKLANEDLAVTIKRRFNGGFRVGLLAADEASRYLSLFFAHKLKEALTAPLHHDADTVIRIIVSRSEIDLEQIKKSFQEISGESLSSWVASKVWVGKEYKDLLLALLKD